MGLGSSLKKTFSAKGLAGLVAAPFTGGTSLTLTASELKGAKAKAMAEKQNALLAAQEALQQKQKAAEEADLERRKREKLADIGARNKQATGLSSLIGGGGTTLG